MSHSEIFKTLEDTFEDSMKAVNATKRASQRVAQQVKRETGDLVLLLKGQVRTFVFIIWAPSYAGAPKDSVARVH